MRASQISTIAILLILGCGGETPQSAGTARPEATATSDTAVTTTTGTTASATPTVRRNHFNGWTLATPIPAPATVILSQPTSGGRWTVTLEKVVTLFNPARKEHNGSHGDIDHPLYYVAYTIAGISSPGTFTVHNQFGIDRWNFTDNEKSWLLVPALRTPHAGPNWGGDHLLCYAVTGPDYAAGPGFTVTDRNMPPRPVTTLTPSHYCVPVTKQRDQGANTEPVMHPRAYLTIYRYALEPPEQFGGSVQMWDQFHTSQPLHLQHMTSDRLAVPAW